MASSCASSPRVPGDACVGERGAGEGGAGVVQRGADVGQRGADVGQRGADVGQRGADVGQRGADVGQRGADVGQRGATAPALTAAQRARIERQRQRARVLHDARLVQQHHRVQEAVSVSGPASARTRDTGGGFLLEDEPEPAPRVPRHAPAPLVHRSEQPHCLECERPFPQSYLFDTFDYSVCDECRDDAEAHALVTRTEAKTEFLLKDCDLDKREPPLRCVRRRNPHKAHYSDMRLYLRPQVEARALQVWGGAAALEEEREARARRRDKALETATKRRLRELRLAARSSLLEGRRAVAAHRHRWGPEAHDAAGDEYSRTCLDCHHTETYEKM